VDKLRPYSDTTVSASNRKDLAPVKGLSNISLYLVSSKGAGKTTTINMILGAVAPTSGTAYIAGKDIRTEIPEIRRDVGVCMQHDCLFPQLTVREHIEFFSRLKGLYSKASREQADKQVSQAMEDVALLEKQNTLSRNLSGGMKRKLSVAISFCGGSKVVILDEPTSGMDPYSRRFTWNLIRHYRQNRCIILTTHFMDEADILGDRIAIMADGRLRCVGSSMFLKKTYGVGYQLTIAKNHKNDGLELLGSEKQKHSTYDATNETKADSEYLVEVDHDGGYGDSDLKQIVLGSVRGAKLLNDVGSELSYQLPFDSSSQFTPMFEKLDEEVENGRIKCYGVSITTLDEVFFMVTGEAMPSKVELASSKLDTDSTEISDASIKESATTQPVVTLEDDGLFWRHLRTLLKKRASIFRRDKKAWLFTTIIPSLFVLLGFLLSPRLSTDRNLPAVTMDLRDYNKKVKSTPRNPIAVNSPDNPYLCQPGICSHMQPVVMENLTDETYFFCGFLARQGLDPESYSYPQSNLTCSITESTDIISSITQAGAFPDEVSVGNISKVSLAFQRCAFLKNRLHCEQKYPYALVDSFSLVSRR